MLHSSTEVLLGISASFKAVGGGVSSPNHRIAEVIKRLRGGQVVPVVGMQFAGESEYHQALTVRIRFVPPSKI